MYNIMNIFIVLLLAILSGIFYHIGGCGKDGITMYPRLPRWIFGKINTKIRDVGCSICVILAILITEKVQIVTNWYLVLISFGLCWLALSMYHKYLNTLFRSSKSDVLWFNWLAHGLGIGLSALPFLWLTVPLWIILVRTILLGLLVMFWSNWIKTAWLEEGGRGILIVLSVLILGVR